MSDDPQSWERNFKALERHVAHAYSFELATSHTLRKWLCTQREAANDGQLLNGRKHRLKAIGVLFNASPRQLDEQTWRLHLAAFEILLSANASYTPASTMRQTTPLDQWVKRQIKASKIGSLPLNREQQLRDIAPTLFPIKRDMRGSRTGSRQPVRSFI